MQLARKTKRRSSPFSNVRQLLACCFLLIGLISHAQNRDSQSTINPKDLYAAFLTKFPHFVEWPQSAERRARATIRLGIFGEGTFTKRTRDLISTQEVDGRAFEVIECKSVSDLTNLDILYIGSKEADRIEEIVSTTAGKGILTIGATQGLARRGAMINITHTAGKTRFEINLRAVNENRLKISTKLLRTALIVE